MTLKECVTDAVTATGLPIAESFEPYDITAAHAGSMPVIFISDYSEAFHGECLSISGSTRREVKSKIKLTVVPPQRHCRADTVNSLDVLKEIFGNLLLDDSFSSPELTVLEAKTSGAHKRVLRQAYISAVQLLPENSINSKEDKI